MYVDLDQNPNATPYYEMNINGKENLDSPGHYFHKPFHILLNLAIGGNFTGIWDINKITALPVDGTPVKMYVDYVRIYQKGVAGELLTAPGLSTAIDTNKPTKKGLYPNPASNHVILDDYQNMSEVTILSTEGRMIQKITQPAEQLDISSLSAGLYFLHIVYDDRTNETQKFIKL